VSLIDWDKIGCGPVGGASRKTPQEPPNNSLKLTRRAADCFRTADNHVVIYLTVRRVRGTFSVIKHVIGKAVTTILPERIRDE
jgi:hypothetical protein